MAPGLADLGVRAVSALVLAPVAVGATWLGGPFFLALTVAAGLVLTWEWVTLAKIQRSPSMPQLGAGLLVIWTAIAAINWVRADPAAGRGNVLFLLGVIWATDIGAYMAGRGIGGPKLAPRISPAKTWAGAIGGAFAGACAGAGAGQIAGTSLGHGAAIAAALSVIAQAGDLLESALKRRFGVKDSGALIPGHGGLLDRLDSTLAVSLAAGLLVILRGRGVVLWG